MTRFSQTLAMVSLISLAGVSAAQADPTGLLGVYGLGTGTPGQPGGSNPSGTGSGAPVTSNGGLTMAGLPPASPTTAGSQPSGTFVTSPCSEEFKVLKDRGYSSPQVFLTSPDYDGKTTTKNVGSLPYPSSPPPHFMNDKAALDQCVKYTDAYVAMINSGPRGASGILLSFPTCASIAYKGCSIN